MYVINRQEPPPPQEMSSEAGFSLIEGLVAAALLLVIAVSVLPLFTRALESNISGGRSSQLATFVNADLETVGQASVDRDDWKIGAAPGGVRVLESYLWDIGPLFDTTSPSRLGDERWIAAVEDPDGLLEPASGTHDGPLMWARGTTIRKYSLSDIRILIGAGGGLATGGASPYLFDSPVTADDENAHITEIRVTVKEQRVALPAPNGQRITVGHMRSF